LRRRHAHCTHGLEGLQQAVMGAKTQDNTTNHSNQKKTHGCSRCRPSRAGSRTARSCCSAPAQARCRCSRAAGRRFCTAGRHAPVNAGTLRAQAKALLSVDIHIRSLHTCSGATSTRYTGRCSMQSSAPDAGPDSKERAVAWQQKKRGGTRHTLLQVGIARRRVRPRRCVLRGNCRCRE